MIDNINITGSIASIIGLFISIYIASKIKFIKNRAQGIGQINDIRSEMFTISQAISTCVPYNNQIEYSEIIFKFESICDLILKYKVFSQLTNKNAKGAKKAIKEYRRQKSSSTWDGIFEYSIKMRSSVESDTKDIPFEGGVIKH